MEKSTVIGLGLGFFAVIVGMILKGASLSSLANPAAFVIIFVGTAAALFIAFPMQEIARFPKLMKVIFVKQVLFDKTQLIELFMDYTTISRREGLLSLESKIEDIKDQFLKTGLRMIIDGNDQDLVHDVMLEEISATEERHKVGALIFSQAGMYAPTLGVLGAVIGLIAALADMSDMEKLAHAIAAAFAATLMGIFSGYVLWHPIATKLKRMSKREIEIRLMMVEGVLSIQSGLSTMAIKQKLSVYLTPTERLQKVEAAKGVEANE